MEKRWWGLIIGIIILVLVLFIFSIYFYPLKFGGSAKNGTDESKYNTYTNQEYKIQISYLKDWYYKEFFPKPVTSSYEVYNYTTKKYDNKFVHENTDFVVAFGPTENLMPTASRGGQGYITIEVFNGSMENLFNQSYERSGWMKYYIETGQKNMSLETFKKDFYGEEITINNHKAFKVISKGQIPDALEDFKIIEVKLEDRNRVISMIMQNVDNLNDTEESYEKMISMFEVIN